MATGVISEVPSSFVKVEHPVPPSPSDLHAPCLPAQADVHQQQRSEAAGLAVSGRGVSLRELVGGAHGTVSTSAPSPFRSTADSTAQARSVDAPSPTPSQVVAPPSTQEQHAGTGARNGRAPPSMKYPCAVCRKIFETNAERREHLSLHHRGHAATTTPHVDDDAAAAMMSTVRSPTGDDGKATMSLSAPNAQTAVGVRSHAALSPPAPVPVPVATAGVSHVSASLLGHRGSRGSTWTAGVPAPPPPSSSSSSSSPYLAAALAGMHQRVRGCISCGHCPLPSAQDRLCESCVAAPVQPPTSSPMLSGGDGAADALGPRGSPPPEFSCSTCGKTFDSPFTCHRHLVTHSPGLAACIARIETLPLFCRRCKMVFLCEDELQQHELSHGESAAAAVTSSTIASTLSAFGTTSSSPPAARQLMRPSYDPTRLASAGQLGFGQTLSLDATAPFGQHGGGVLPGHGTAYAMPEANHLLAEGHASIAAAAANALSWPGIVMTATTDERRRCSYCSRQFRTAADCARHIAAEHMSSPAATATAAAAATATLGTGADTSRTNQQQSQLTATTCQKPPTLRSLQYRCHCQASGFPTLHQLQEHQRGCQLMQREAMQLTCDRCDVKFPSAQLLAMHMEGCVARGNGVVTATPDAAACTPLISSSGDGRRGDASSTSPVTTVASSGSTATSSSRALPAPARAPGAISTAESSSTRAHGEVSCGNSGGAAVAVTSAATGTTGTPSQPGFNGSRRTRDDSLTATTLAAARASPVAAMSSATSGSGVSTRPGSAAPARQDTNVTDHRPAAEASGASAALAAPPQAPQAPRAPQAPQAHAVLPYQQAAPLGGEATLAVGTDTLTTAPASSSGSPTAVAVATSDQADGAARKLYPCPDCDAVLDSPRRLRLHAVKHELSKAERTMLESGLLPCAVCKTTCGTVELLNQHHEWHVDTLAKQCSSNLLPCEVCSKEFSSKFGLVRHYFVHSDVRAFECGVCHKRYRDEKARNTHMLTHVQGKQFECKECGKKYVTASSLSQHRMVHTGSVVKRYACQFCEKMFRAPSDLVRHVATHTKVRPHACKHCPATFNKKNQLKLHEMNAHMNFGDVTTGVDGRSGGGPSMEFSPIRPVAVSTNPGGSEQPYSCHSDDSTPSLDNSYDTASSSPPSRAQRMRDIDEALCLHAYAGARDGELPPRSLRIPTTSGDDLFCVDEEEDDVVVTVEIVDNPASDENPEVSLCRATSTLHSEAVTSSGGVGGGGGGGGDMMVEETSSDTARHGLAGGQTPESLDTSNMVVLSPGCDGYQECDDGGRMMNVVAERRKHCVDDDDNDDDDDDDDDVEDDEMCTNALSTPQAKRSYHRAADLGEHELQLLGTDSSTVTDGTATSRSNAAANVIMNTISLSIGDKGILSVSQDAAKIISGCQFLSAIPATSTPSPVVTSNFPGRRKYASNDGSSSREALQASDVSSHGLSSSHGGSGRAGVPIQLEIINKLVITVKHE